MSALKSEFYHHYYEGCRRPASHETLGRLPEWLALAGRLDKATGGRALAAANALVTGAPRSLLSAAMRVAGLTDRRSLPPFAPADAWIAEARRAGVSRPRSGHGDVLLLTDTFTRAFRPHLAGAAGAVLAGVDAGRAVEAAPDGDTRPIVVVEPSCAAALRHDFPRIVHSDQARRVAERVRSFAVEVADMAAEGRLAQPAHPLPEEVVVQGHCHEYATFGPTTQKRAIDAAGSVRAPVIREAVGCCGVAGNFGFEAEHYEVSVKVAEQALIPAIEGSASDAPVLTDGFSCAMQVDHVAPGRRALHLAEMLDPRPSSM